MGAFLFETVAGYVGAAFVVAVGLFAFIKGGQPEKIGAGAFLFGWFASLMAQTAGGYFGVQWGVFALDVVMLIIFAAMVWKAPRSWPVWACALQLLAVTSHVMVMLNLRPPISAFYTVVNMTGYGIMLAIAIGTFWAWQERRAIGQDAD
ncbi:hypothetical protein CQ035_10105 [Brevundimonas sp. MYb46]|nr:hypothetical protein CQ026_07585 [Brevundimonas sp. MYb31]PRA30896.1 hypothetical protein CQ024_07295 [Brevundimonas sp. MYb27]PRB16758.1 hypothetical protein CQ039_03625 [Brevundimonas sp. MYb52]PRB34705.1 hypothetical protein CQ035_10105 [Brevundimonas sp. MYb46]PRB54728.1 hypothetical protein CQ028_04110 [Brevundimonas sp. MYb33]